MGKRVVLVRHGDGPADDRVVTWLARNGVTADIRRPYQGETLGEIGEDVAATVIYGGMYNAYDTGRHPFLNEEYKWIGAAMAAGIPLLGICQGAQMIAHHNGAWVGPVAAGTHEFGYYEVRPIDGVSDFLPGPLHVTQAHFHTFDIPSEAEHLARSDLFENQAFRIGDTVYGLQFHPEQHYVGFQRWQTQSDSYGSPGAQTKALQDQLGPQVDAAQDVWFMGFLDRFMGAACK